MTLMDAAERHSNVRIQFNERCTGFDFVKRSLELHNETTRKETSVRVNRVIGTDGSASAIRTDMSKTGRFNLSQQYIEHGYVRPRNAIFYQTVK